MPRADANMYTMKAEATPLSEIRPALRPWQIERETRYIIFGPGVITIPSATREKPSNAGTATIVISDKNFVEVQLCQRRPHRACHPRGRAQSHDCTGTPSVRPYRVIS